jgi:trimeric autotransporter adhesin
MKTLRTISTVLLAAFLVLGPMAAFAAGETVTVATDKHLYSGQATIQVSGTVTPAPSSAGTAVVVTTTGPMGAVDTGEALVAATAGTYSYVLVAGSSLWINGNYKVNATYGGPGGTGSATTTFAYNGASGGNNTVITTTITSTTTVTTAVTSTITVPSSDVTQLNAIQASLLTMTSTLGTISSAITALTGSVNTLQSGVTGIVSQLTSVSSGISSVSGISSQLTKLNDGINNNQTYVLVVAALAAITLVLELAILVRKLS